MNLSRLFPAHMQTLDPMIMLGLVCGIFWIGGVFGFIYETIFYYFNDGKILKRGSSFGPWIQIYGFGSVLIFFAAAGKYQTPLMVFLISGLLCGALEFIAGYLMYHLGGGFRSWDYNTEKWNWGNIGGYICFRSVAFFATSGLLLIYIINPLLLKISDKVSTNVFVVPSVILSVLFLLDIIYNDILVKFLPFEDAFEFYEKRGWPNNMPKMNKK